MHFEVNIGSLFQGDWDGISIKHRTKESERQERDIRDTGETREREWETGLERDMVRQSARKMFLIFPGLPAVLQTEGSIRGVSFLFFPGHCHVSYCSCCLQSVALPIITHVVVLLPPSIN